MKKTLRLFLIIIMLLGLSGCKWVITKEKENLNPQEANGMHMMIDPNTKSTNGLHYYIYNKSKWDVMYGESYYIQKKDNTGWENLVPHEGMFFEQLGYVIKPMSTKEETVDWSSRYGSLEKGSYRLCKAMSIEEPTSQYFEICAYFEID